MALSNSIRKILNNCPFIKQPCLLCARHEAQHGICAGCRTDLHRLDSPLCPLCAEPQALDLGGAPCGRCQRRTPAFDRLYAPFRYDYPLAEVIQAYKYGKRLELAGVLAPLLAEFAAKQQTYADLVIPVPLFRDRLAERGFNQCDALGQALAGTLAARFEPNLCWRKRNTAVQASLGRAERRRNLRDAFGVKHRIDGLCVAIVDDVASSGATLNSLAAMLKKQGAKRVDAWALSRSFSTKT